MLTSFFRKSKPLNFLLVGLTAIFFFILVNTAHFHGGFSWQSFLEKTGVVLAYLLSGFFINFTEQKTKPDARHTFVLFLFLLFSIAFPPILTKDPALIAGFFVILGLRQSFALQTGHKLSKKIFDTFFCLSLAVLFFPATAFFMIVPVFGIMGYTSNNYRYWGIPLVSIFTVYILTTAFWLFVHDVFFNPLQLFDFTGPGFQLYAQSNLFWPLLLLIAFAGWALFNFFADFNKGTQNEKYSRYLLLICFLAAIGVVLFSAENTGAELLFLIIPVTLMGGHYFEKPTHKWSKEILLLSLTILSLFFALISIW